ncbi:MAG: hypothetical protein GYB49_08885 [Alphaproteobacteria bacterium]|jgi:hypothetical protein|nr:hypothetical protein [Hyphomonas sp.]MBR9807322.1 hypothetical protein [Alphaproteobacteria bacterium]|tara:strand:- start:3941 stop:4492 length:552 start_codon:yes stop_codon:yes gene_type:complete
MQDTLNQIPPEAWPFIDLMFNLTMAAAGIWLGLTVFVLWRRHASNLTPVNSAEKSRKAQPDFLKVDHKARAEAIKRGEAFEKELDQRDIAERKAEAKRQREKVGLLQRLSGIVALVMSLFTIVSIIYGSIFTVTRMGDMMEEYSTAERMIAIIQTHPIAFSVCVIVILARIYTYFAKPAQKEG